MGKCSGGLIKMAVSAINSSVMVQALNKSVQDVYYTLLGRKMKVKEIERKTNYSPRTIRQALKTLSELNLIAQVPDLTDLRSHYYVGYAS